MMGAPMITIDAASERALSALSKVMTSRCKYLRETAQTAAHAILNGVLGTLKTTTKVAKASTLKVTLKERGDLHFSFWTTGKAVEVRDREQIGMTDIKLPRKMCVRNAGGVRIRDNSCGRIRFLDCQGVPAKTVKCFEFVDEYERGGVHFADRYLLVAPTKGKANKAAKEIVSRRVIKYAGLARHALAVLTTKIGGRSPSNASNAVNSVAYGATRTLETTQRLADGSGIYTIAAHDNLAYATDALKDGRSAIDVAVRKTVNKMVGRITHQFSKSAFFDARDLPPVFDEVKQIKKRAS